MSIAEQALSLPDIFPSIRNRSNLENFTSLDGVIVASFSPPGPLPVISESAPVSTENLYAVASRMGRANYDEQAKAEALLNALKQMRAKNAGRPNQTARVLRGT
jgi:hypothetical protein